MNQPIIQGDDEGARLNEPGWAVLARTPGNPLLGVMCPGIFYDLGFTSPPIYGTFHSTVPRHCTGASGLMLWQEGK